VVGKQQQQQQTNVRAAAFNFTSQAISFFCGAAIQKKSRKCHMKEGREEDFHSDQNLR
jgi:hypothetical protein